MTKHKILAVNTLWGAIFILVAGTAIVGAGTYAWNANADFAVLQSDMQAIKQASLPSRLDKLEEQVKQSVDAAQRLEKQQDKMDEKLDKLLQRTR